ncbi:MAG: 5-carboxymethyl-2-hydroxymuconate Delta-isomerase [Pseudomonadota bacterium]
MPHLILEYSSNLIEKNNFQKLFAEFNPLLAKTLDTDISGCKCRAVELKDYYIGDSNPNQAFVHMELKVLRGRDSAKLRDIGTKLMELARTYFAESFKKLSTQLTLEIVELSPNYFKFSSQSTSIKVF